ncbi:MAG: hypothetical protein U1F57_03170 [bacterium]
MAAAIAQNDRNNIPPVQNHSQNDHSDDFDPSICGEPRHIYGENEELGISYDVVAPCGTSREDVLNRFRELTASQNQGFISSLFAYFR